MAESRRDGPPALKEAEGQSDGSPGVAAAAGDQERVSETARHQAERLGALRREGIQRATEASAAAVTGAMRSGSAIADSAREITTAWAGYAEEVMRHTSEASHALLRARTFNEMLDVQAKLLRDNMQAFLDQTVKVTEAASRMATRPLEAMKEASAEQTRR
jgi:hypothetical protein